MFLRELRRRQYTFGVVRTWTSASCLQARATLLPNRREKGIKLIDKNRCVLLNCKHCFVIVFFAIARRIFPYIRYFYIEPYFSWIIFISLNFRFEVSYLCLSNGPPDFLFFDLKAFQSLMFWIWRALLCNSSLAKRSCLINFLSDKWFGFIFYLDGL